MTRFTHMEPTVVAEYESLKSENADTHGTESMLEAALIEQLQRQGYERVSISNEESLKANLRSQIERLNGYKFSDSEWSRFFSESVSASNDSIIDKTTRIQEAHIQEMRRDDGTIKNIALIDKVNIHNNHVQVINQYEAGATRYDVTILVNGLPLVHIELKRRGIDLREAFNQIDRYQRDSFLTGSGLFGYIQLFVISNGTLTKYYSNTVRDSHVAEHRGRGSKTKTLNSFSFTNWWADARNVPITDIEDFARTFFAKHTLLNIITKYCVFDVDRKLVVMRPYQIAAAERIMQRILATSESKRYGTVDAGGYIWHTTGSGKTLTSFKTAQLARQLPGVDKVLFIVDRKDLDYQTMREYERFEKGAANSNASTSVLQKQLEDSNARVIITTIQKLSRFINKNKQHSVYDAHVVMIFDECHRSQFGEMHTDITRTFKRYHIFGFTGTPIFGENGTIKTTAEVFGDRLHSYTIVDAIGNKTVLPFRVEFNKTFFNVSDKNLSKADIDRALLNPERMSQVVSYILEHFNDKTKRSFSYTIEGRKVNGFNSLFATQSIEAAMKYYSEFKRQQSDKLESDRLKVGLVYSFTQNEDPDGFFSDETCEADGLDISSRDFLNNAIQDYNAMFSTNFDTSPDKFQNYYKDLSQRIKRRELDIVIVVNMLLTGFDATTLNTLWVDKDMRAHGLIQAFSRTNRILNSIKTYGHVVTFRNLEQETNDALSLFGNQEAKDVALLGSFDSYYDPYKKLMEEFQRDFVPGAIPVGEEAQRDFVQRLGTAMRLQNVLKSFDEFADVVPDRDMKDYKSVYLDLQSEFKNRRAAGTAVSDDGLIFEIELIKQVDITVDYILRLVERYLKERGSSDEELRDQVNRTVKSDPSFHNRSDIFTQFVDTVQADESVDDAWERFITAKRMEELDRIIAAHNLNADAAVQFMKDAFRDGEMPTSGTVLVSVLPPARRFGNGSGHAERKRAAVDALKSFFERFYGLG